MHLDTICTMVDVDAMVMYPAVADTLQAWTVTAGDQPPDDADTTELAVSGPQPFLVAAAAAMGIDRLRLIDTGLDPVTAEREQWDDGNNTLALAPRLAVAYERNTVTNAALEAAGIEVVRSPARSWAAVAAARGACPARCCGSRCGALTAPGRSGRAAVPGGRGRVGAASRPHAEGPPGVQRVGAPPAGEPVRPGPGRPPGTAAGRPAQRQRAHQHRAADEQQVATARRACTCPAPRSPRVTQLSTAVNESRNGARPRQPGQGRRRRGSRRPGPGSRRRSRG